MRRMAPSVLQSSCVMAKLWPTTVNGIIALSKYDVDNSVGWKQRMIGKGAKIVAQRSLF